MDKFKLVDDREENIKRTDEGVLDHVCDKKGEAVYSGKINMLLLNKMYSIYDFISNDEKCYVADGKLINDSYSISFNITEDIFVSTITSLKNNSKLVFTRTVNKKCRRNYCISLDNNEKCEFQENIDIGHFDSKNDNIVCDFFDMFNLTYFRESQSACIDRIEELSALRNKSGANELKRKEAKEQQIEKQNELKNKLSDF